jgi:hypothetical protein
MFEIVVHRVPRLRLRGPLESVCVPVLHITSVFIKRCVLLSTLPGGGKACTLKCFTRWEGTSKTVALGGPYLVIIVLPSFVGWQAKR